MSMLWGSALRSSSDERTSPRPCQCRHGVDSVSAVSKTGTSADAPMSSVSGLFSAKVCTLAVSAAMTDEKAPSSSPVT